MQTHRDNSPTRRPAFTLLELLIVIGILSVLVSLSVALIGNMLSSANRAATLVTLAKLDRLIGQQLDAFHHNFNPNTMSRSEALLNSAKFLSRNSPLHMTNDQEVAIVLWIKEAYRQAFPQNAQDLYGFDGQPGRANFDDDGINGTDDPGEAGVFDDSPIAGSWKAGGGPNATAQQILAAESSEILYLALTEGTISGAPPADVSEFTGSEIGDTDGDGLMEFIDAWGRPIRFYRWPTRLFNPWGFVADTSSAFVSSTATTIPLSDASGFATVLSDLQGVDPTATIKVVIGREVVEVDNVSGNDLNISSRGANPTEHGAGSVVKLGPFTDMALLLFGSVNSTLMSQDPNDPQGLLPANLPSGSPSITPAAFETAFHTLDSYHAPLIVSAGFDGLLGLNEPSDTGTNGHLAMPVDFATVAFPGDSALTDNLTNRSEGIGR